MTTDQQALAKNRNGQQLQTVTSTMSIQELAKQVETIQNAMGEVMHEDEHFGTIPGTSKPTLYKAGAEKLALLFRLAPEYKVKQTDLEGGHREYEVITRLVHIPTGDFVGEGIGVCTTMESKYRYRKIEKKTDVTVPKSFWNSGRDMKSRDKSILRKELQSKEVKIPSSAEVWTSKDSEGTWWIALKGKGENPDIADTYNTVAKMAKKRSQVDATLTATAASDIFTQDLDDMNLGKDKDKDSESEDDASEGKSSGDQPANLSDNAKKSIIRWLNVLPQNHPHRDIDLAEITTKEYQRLGEFLKLYRDVRKGIQQMKEKGNLSKESFNNLAENLRNAKRIRDLEIIIDDMELIEDDPDINGVEQSEQLYDDPSSKKGANGKNFDLVKERGQKLHGKNWVTESKRYAKEQNENAQTLLDLNDEEMGNIALILKSELENGDQ